MLTLNVTNRIIMKITVWLIPTRQRFDNCLLKKFNYTGYCTSDNEPAGIENATHNTSGGKAGYLSPPCPSLHSMYIPCIKCGVGKWENMLSKQASPIGNVV
jgi:hypothetical protein